MLNKEEFKKLFRKIPDEMTEEDIAKGFYGGREAQLMLLEHLNGNSQLTKRVNRYLTDINFGKRFEDFFR